MDDDPSLLAWLALLGLWVATGLGAVVSERHKTPRPSGARPPGLWLLVPPATCAALLPVVAVLSGAPWSGVAWWTLAIVPITVSLAASMVVVAAAARPWPELDDGIGRFLTATALVVTGLIPAILIPLAASGVELEVAVALALLASYLVWHAAWTRVRRLSPPSAGHEDPASTRAS
jgi:hypothetical protein